MPLDSKVVRCGNCGRILDEPTELPTTDLKPCPDCGSLERNVHVTIQDSGTIHEKLTSKGRRTGERRPFIEQVSGDDLQIKTGIWMELHRIIDRAKDWYYERITNPKTGKVIHETKEPLSKHQGHGSAVKRK